MLEFLPEDRELTLESLDHGGVNARIDVDAGSLARAEASDRSNLSASDLAIRYSFSLAICNHFSNRPSSSSLLFVSARARYTSTSATASDSEPGISLP